MNIEFTLIGPGGETHVVRGEALPKFDRLQVDRSINLTVSEEDLNTLKRATQRYWRAIEARIDVGDIRVHFEHPNGFRNEIPLDEGKIKLLALEARPFFLEKDSLFFLKISSLRSLGSNEALRPVLKRHKQRWAVAAFGGAMQMKVNSRALDMMTVVQTWFNCDFFHSEPVNAEDYSLDVLVSSCGSRDVAMALVANHMANGLQIVNEFLNDLVQICPAFRDWLIPNDPMLTQLQKDEMAVLSSSLSGGGALPE